MEPLLMLLASVGIGAFAQMKKGRTGIAWVLITLVVTFLMYLAMYPDPSDYARSPQIAEVVRKLGSEFRFAVLGALMITVPLMLLVVATLPKKKGEEAVPREVKPVKDKLVWGNIGEETGTKAKVIGGKD